MATLLSAGLEPTINQLGIMVSVLSSRPDIWQSLAAGEVTASTVVEAVLRFRSTNQGAARFVAEPFDYHGVHFDDGEAVLVGLAAANHDPRQFPSPEELVLEGERSSHLAFGFGPHFCLGAALARVQLQEALSALTRGMTRPEITHLEELEPGGLIGPSSLTLSFSARDAAGGVTRSCSSRHGTTAVVAS